MKEFRMKACHVPKNRRADVDKLREEVRALFDVHMSQSTAYEFWDAVSESYAAGWLSIDTDGGEAYESREEFLSEMMQKFGYVTETVVHHSSMYYN